jgi:hypothetical protein
VIFEVPQSVEQLILKAEERLGISGVLSLLGPSEFGWSKLKKFLQCDYLAFADRLLPENPFVQSIPEENENTALGTVSHRTLELHYLPEQICDPIIYLGALKEVGLSDDLYTEAKRIFTGYVKHYGNERSYMTPLGVEQTLTDPETGLTAKVDLLADFNGHGKYPDGIHVVDHKTRSRIDAQCLNEWFMDGQVLMNFHLCDVNGIPVKGFIANIIGKQKTQRFERIYVPFDRERLERFRRDVVEKALERYREVEQAMRLWGEVPMRSYSCTGRYGLCELFNHCKMS